MADLEFIAPTQVITVKFGLEPAYNALNSLYLLNEADETSGFSEWTYQTLAALTPEQRRETSLVTHALCVGEMLDHRSWPSFPDWVEDLVGRDSVTMRDQILACTLDDDKAVDETGHPLTPAALLADRETYLNLLQQRYQEKGYEPDWSIFEEAHELFSDPPALKARIVTHLGWLWTEVLALAWEESLPVLQESVAAFQAMRYEGLSRSDVFRQVVQREIPDVWGDKLNEVTHLTFIPSTHIGPYVLLIDHTRTMARVVFGARLPQPVAGGAGTISSTELRIRLDALADDTRIQILRLLAQADEVCAQDIITRFKLSQSAASRHMRQLSATGFVVERRRDGAKCYRLNRDRFGETFETLLAFLE